jgi:hypothetical protein
VGNSDPTAVSTSAMAHAIDQANGEGLRGRMVTPPLTLWVLSGDYGRSAIGSSRQERSADFLLGPAIVFWTAAPSSFACC